MNPSITQLFAELERHSPDTWEGDVPSQKIEAAAYTAALTTLLTHVAENPQSPGLLRQIGHRVAVHCGAYENSPIPGYLGGSAI